MRRARRIVGVTLAVAIAILVGAGGRAYWLRLRTWHAFVDERNQMEALLRQKREPCPAGVEPRHWEAAWEITYNALGNVCFSPERVTVREMQRLRGDMERKAAETGPLDFLRWLWNRLAQTGPRGREYIERMTPLLEEAIPHDSPHKASEKKGVGTGTQVVFAAGRGSGRDL